jgi:hypothetical protein
MTIAWHSTCCNGLRVQELQLFSWHLSTAAGQVVPPWQVASSFAHPSTRRPMPTRRAPAAWRTCSSFSLLLTGAAVWPADIEESWWGNSTASVAPTSVANRSCEIVELERLYKLNDIAEQINLIKLYHQLVFPAYETINICWTCSR